MPLNNKKTVGTHECLLVFVSAIPFIQIADDTNTGVEGGEETGEKRAANWSGHDWRTGGNGSAGTGAGQKKARPKQQML